MISMLLFIALIFGFHYWKKKKEARKFEKIYKPEATSAHVNGYGNPIADHNYFLFDQFVKSQWPEDFMSWECLDNSGICSHFEGPHQIMVYNTMGGNHKETIIVETKSAAEDRNEFGIIYNFRVRKKYNPGDNPQENEPEDEDDKPTKPEKPTPDKDKTPEELAKEWLEKNISWIRDKVNESYVIIPFGEKENEINEELKQEIFDVINDLNEFQVQIEENGIGVYQAPDI